MFKLPVSPKKIVILLAVIIIGLTIASLIGQYYKDFVGDDPFILKIVGKFDLDEEANNLPTWYQSSTLLLCSVLLLVIAFIRQSFEDVDTKFWALMAAIFLYLSIDEAVSIHEQLIVPLRHGLNAHGVWFSAWVIPALFLLVVLFALVFKSLWRLSPRTRWLFIISGTIYVAGAVGMEMIGAKYYEIHLETQQDAKDFGYALLTTTEEFLEMSGIALFIFSLLRYVENEAFLKVSAAEQTVPVPMNAEVSLGK